MFKSFRIISIVGILAVILSACNLPASQQTPTEDPNSPNVIFTAAALTVQAQSTQLAPFNTPTLPPPPPTNTAVTIPTNPPPTNTPVVSPTAQCDLALFVDDVTYDDGTNVAAGTTFKKTWRLRNIGTCTWSGYSLVFDSGETMSPTPDVIGVVAPGQEVDVSVTFTAPLNAGTYRSYWRLRNGAGVLLPVVQGWQGKGFFVDIRVGSSGFDLHTRASNATWTSGAGNLTFGGPDTDINGFAMYKDGQKLEDGSTHSKILITYPQQVNDGLITGRYPAYTVVGGERFTARIGFLAQPDSSCGTGNVRFKLGYREGGVLKPLGEWTETCDGTLRSLNVDLTNLAGKSVEFVLEVLANGPSTQDVAVWVAPQIAIP